MQDIIDILKCNGINIVQADADKSKLNDGDIIYEDASMFGEIIMNGSLGLGESYMAKKWYCHNGRLDVLIHKVLSKNLQNSIKPKSWSLWLWEISTYLLNYQTRTRSYNVEDVHYNIGNDLYVCMLGPTMAYTCAYFKDGNNDLDTAQYEKFRLICDKIQLQDTDKVLDIGCGFGTLAKYMAEQKNCTVLGVNISKEQLKFANDNIRNVDQQILSRLSYISSDYRDITGRFTKIVSIGLCEHVGYKNYRTFFEKVHECLEDNGIFLMHTIGSNESVTCTDPWTDKYIFPGGMLPSIKQIGEAYEGLFVLEDVHNFGPDYDKTLLAWHKNYCAARKEKKINKDEVFDRMWEYYLLSSAGSFRARKMQLWQFVFTKNRETKYTGPR
jgi:cyclopropane-fatty-acyl-phospholipid synthase